MILIGLYDIDDEQEEVNPNLTDNILGADVYDPMTVST